MKKTILASVVLASTIILMSQINILNYIEIKTNEISYSSLETPLMQYKISSIKLSVLN